MKIAGASRYGIEGKLIDFGREAEVETRSLINELLELSRPKSKSREQARDRTHRTDHAEGTGRSPTRRFSSDQRHEAVVDQIVAETYEGLNMVATD
jgi:carboxylate-amine ligase